MGITRKQIEESTDEELVDLLGKELNLRVSTKPGTPEHVLELRTFPVGLRAMAATHLLDVSLSLDDLGWHFGNWHNKENARETLYGLIELGATELAEIFEQAFEIVQEYWEEMGAENWADWYYESALEERVDPLNAKAWALLEKSKLGILQYWSDYARRYPDRVGAG